MSTGREREIGSGKRQWLGTRGETTEVRDLGSWDVKGMRTMTE